MIAVNPYQVSALKFYVMVYGINKAILQLATGSRQSVILCLDHESLLHPNSRLLTYIQKTRDACTMRNLSGMVRIMRRSILNTSSVYYMQYVCNI